MSGGIKFEGTQEEWDILVKKNDFPRRNQLDKYTPAELAIYKAMEEVEKVGADLRLTDAITKLNQAKNLVADFVEGIEQPLKKAFNLDFGQAVEAIKHGNKVSRIGWNGKGMWLQLQNKRTLGIPLDGDKIGNMLPYIAMKIAGSGEWGEESINLVPWLASQTDMLAEDWQLVE